MNCPNCQSSKTYKTNPIVGNSELMCWDCGYMGKIRPPIDMDKIIETLKKGTFFSEVTTNEVEEYKPLPPKF